jgi:iron complex outermembrane recepter protein
VPVAANAQDNFGRNPFTPTVATSYEGGVKAELFDKRLTATFAYFDIRKKDTINTFTCLTAAQLTANGITIPAGATVATGSCSAPIGGERSKGIEFEISANPVDGWTLSAGYSHINARVTASNVVDTVTKLPVQTGARLTNSPNNTFNLWSRYDFQSGPLKNLGIGFGVAHTGDRVGYLPVATLPAGITTRAAELLDMPAFTVVDLGVYYKAARNMDFTFKVANLFDKRFIESTGFSGDFQMLPGQPRLATVSARFSF